MWLTALWDVFAGLDFVNVTVLDISVVALILNQWWHFACKNLIFLPFSCWNRQIWSNIETFAIIIVLGGKETLLGKMPLHTPPPPPWRYHCPSFKYDGWQRKCPFANSVEFIWMTPKQVVLFNQNSPKMISLAWFSLQIQPFNIRNAHNFTSKFLHKISKKRKLKFPLEITIFLSQKCDLQNHAQI